MTIEKLSNVRLLRVETDNPTLKLPEMPQSPSELAHLATLPASPTGIAAAGAPPMPTTPTPEALTLTASWHLFRSMLGVLTAISMILATRALLLMAVVGAAVLAWKGMENQTLMSLCESGVYDLAVVVPIVWLYLKRG